MACCLPQQYPGCRKSCDATFRVITCEALSAAMDTWGIPELTSASLAPLATRRHCDEFYIRPALTWPSWKVRRYNMSSSSVSKCSQVTRVAYSGPSVNCVGSKSNSYTNSDRFNSAGTKICQVMSQFYPPLILTTERQRAQFFLRWQVLLLFKKFPTYYVNSKVHYRVHNSPPLSIPADANHSVTVPSPTDCRTTTLCTKILQVQALLVTPCELHV
jgi:hypothetical protein